MKKLIFILMVWGCDFAPTEHTHEHEHDTTNEYETESELIDRECVVVKSLKSASENITKVHDTTTPSCPTENPVVDCAGECGGDAVEQTYYNDYDGDGLGNNDYSEVFCSAEVQEGWVLNDDDDDDRRAICIGVTTFNISDDDYEIENGSLSFSYNEEDYLIDVSSCLDVEFIQVTRIVQDTELEILYVYFDYDVEMLNYSSPNEILYIK